MSLNFNARDIDRSWLKQRALAEARQIHSKESTARGRSIEQITETCMAGHCAEIWLLSRGYIDDTRPYKDLLEPDHNPIEVKATENLQYADGTTGIDHVLRRCKEKILQGWGNHPKRVYVFTYSKHTLDYTFEGIYDWCEKSKTFIRREAELQGVHSATTV